jgi:starch-binding outer membrane protein, SusD/RagB family
MKTVSRRPLILGTALLFAAATAYGCGDFLDEASAPQGTLNEETLANRAGVEGTLIAAYRALDWNNGVGGAWGNAASGWVWGSVPSDDAYKGSEAPDQPPIDDIEQFQWGTPDAESYLNDKWRGVYEGVVRANSTLRLLAKVQADNPSEFSTAEANTIRGEALFLRAHFHFEAWRMWGNVPYYDEDDTDFRKANNANPATGVTETATAILADLDAAIAALPTTARAKARVSQWTAKAYKGRVQVYAGQYAAALTTLRDVRTNGPYRLETSFDRVWTGYTDLENGPETILAYQASVNDGEPNGNNANYGERLNFPHSGSYYGCCGFHQPSQELVNFFRVNAAGLPISLTDATWNASNANFVGGNMAPVDPRLDWTVGRDGVPFKDAGVHAATWIRAPAYGGPYSAKKNVHERTSGSESTVGWVPTQLNGVNIHIFRYADMLLLLAEAEVEAGLLPNALAIVNEIRARAGVRVQGVGQVGGSPSRAAIAVPMNDPSVTWADYEIGLYPAFASQAEARTAVRNERRLELAMEGQRFFDLRRWGIADAVLNAHIAVERTRRPHLGNSQTFAARHRWYPIPAIQIQLSRVDGQARLTQNPGW